MPAAPIILEMGVSDRDWYRDELRRRERPFARGRHAPGSRDGITWTGLLALLSGAVAVFLLGFQAHAVWKARKDADQALQNPGVVRIPASETADPPSRAAMPPAEELPAAPPPQARTIYRCIVDGKVMYSGVEDCRGRMSTNTVESAAPGAPPGISAYGQEMLRSADARHCQAGTRSPAGRGRESCFFRGFFRMCCACAGDSSARQPSSTAINQLRAGPNQSVQGTSAIETVCAALLVPIYQTAKSSIFCPLASAALSHLG